MKNLIQAAVVILFAASAAQAQQAVQWKVSDGGNGHWFQIVVSPERSWHSCRDSARAVGGDLASLTSAAEHQFVVGIAFTVPSAFIGAQGPFIGAFQDTSARDYSEPAAGWRWSDGEPWSYAGWLNQVEPSDCFLSCSQGECIHENHVQLYGPQYGGAWNDISAAPVHCDGTWVVRAFVIEWSADCNGDGIVDYGQCRDGSLPDYNGNNIPDCCEAGTPCVVGSHPGTYPIQWRIRDGGNGHWYARTDAHLPWGPLQSWCVARGGHLVTLTGAEEHSWIKGALPVVEHFVGGYQDVSAPDYSEPLGGWRWVTGEPFSVIPAFMSVFDDCPGGSPGWCGCGTPGAQNVLVFVGCCGEFVDDIGDGVVQNCNSDARRGIIEWTADCNNDGIVDKGQILLGQLPDVNNNGIPDPCEQPTCRAADLFADRSVNGIDLGILLGQWGPNTQYTISDINSDGVVDGSDLGLLLSFWGPCPY